VYVAIGGVEADQTAGLTRLETGEGEAQPAEGAVLHEVVVLVQMGTETVHGQSVMVKVVAELMV